MQSDVTIILKNEDTTFKKQFNCYDPVCISEKCDYLTALIEKAKNEFKCPVDEVIINIRAYW